MSERDTRERLLDAAEQLIARKGYANMSLREITGKAGANLAAVNYHFGSKEGLAKAMIDRILIPLNSERLKLMETELTAAEKAGRLPDTAPLLRALIEPILRLFQSGDHGRRAMALFNEIHSASDDTIRRLFLGHMAPVFKAFFQSFKDALPGLSPDKLMARMFFCIGALGHGACILADDELARRAAEQWHLPVPDPQSVVEELIQFTIRGMGET